MPTLLVEDFGMLLVLQPLQFLLRIISLHPPPLSEVLSYWIKISMLLLILVQPATFLATTLKPSSRISRRPSRSTTPTAPPTSTATRVTKSRSTR